MVINGGHLEDNMVILIGLMIPKQNLEKDGINFKLLKRKTLLEYSKLQVNTPVLLQYNELQ